MPNSPEISMDLKGGATHLSDFTVICSALRSSLNGVARCVTNHDEIECEVSELSKASAHLTVLPLANGIADAAVVEVSRLYTATLHALEHGKPVDSRLDFRAISAFNLFSGVAKNANVTLDIGGVRLTKRFAETVAALLVADDSAYGSVSGRLETVTIHNQSKFTLFPPVKGEEVDCHFADSELKKVLDSVGHYVTVYGNLFYAKTKSFPVRVDVASYEELPVEDLLPTLLDCRGSLPTLDGTLTRETHDEWQ
jgi:hypothetical protein